MFKYSYNELKEAMEIFQLVGIENRNDIKNKYLKLSKKYHPDMQDGDIEKFQNIHKAYKVLISYIDNFRFRFTEDEFKTQYYSSFEEYKEWKFNNI